MTSLVVEAHRKRFTIKAGPMKPLLEVVREVLVQLKLEDLDPARCLLHHNKKALDLSTPVRLANLPSGSKLELTTGHEPRLGVQDTGPAAAVPTPPAAAAPAPAQPATAPAHLSPALAPQQQQQQQPAIQQCSLPAAAAPAAPMPQSAAPPASAAPTPAAPAPAVPAAPPAAAAEAGASGSMQPGALMAMEGPLPQHPSVAVFGQEVAVFTREAELALESSHMDVDEREPPDEFYELTEGDLQRAAASLARAKAQAEGSGAVLMTKQMREAEEARRAAAYGPVTLRITLPDGHVLQASFPAAQPLAKLRALVARALAEHVGERFYLYTTPPKLVLKDMATTFYKAGLIPAARVHVGLEGGPLPEGTPLLRPEVLALAGPPPDKASALHRGTGSQVGNGGDKRRGDGGGAVGGAGPSVGPRGSAGGVVGGSQGRSGAQAGGGSGGAVPKWLKLGAK